MDHSINQLFSFDTGIYNWDEIIKDKDIGLPVSKNTLTVDEDDSFLSLAISQASVKSLDYEIEEIILSLIKDMDRVRTNSFATLLDETLLSIEKQLINTQDIDTQQALSDLIDLLKENADLASLFQSYTNWLQKA